MQAGDRLGAPAATDRLVGTGVTPLALTRPIVEESRSLINFNIDGVRLLRRLGEGTYGQVFAVDTSHGLIAVKLSKLRGLSRGNLREAAITVRLSHPNVNPLISAGFLEDFQFLAYPYASQNLHKLITSGGIADENTRLRYTYQIMCAVDYCHQCAVYHRDIKPDNIHVTGDGNIILADFGLARAFSCADGMQLSRNVNTRWYSAPEVVYETVYNETADNWSIASTIYQLYTGKVLLQSATSLEAAAMIQALLGPVPDSYKTTSYWRRWLNSSNSPYVIIHPVGSMSHLLGEFATAHPIIGPLINRFFTYDLEARPTLRATILDPLFDPVRSVSEKYSARQCVDALDARALSIIAPDDELVSNGAFAQALIWLLDISIADNYTASYFLALHLYTAFLDMCPLPVAPEPTLEETMYIDIATAFYTASVYIDAVPMVESRLLRHVHTRYNTDNLPPNIIDLRSRDLLAVINYDLVIATVYDYYRRYHVPGVDASVLGSRMLYMISITPLFIRIHPRYLAQAVVISEHEYNGINDPFVNEVDSRDSDYAYTQWYLILQEYANPGTLYNDQLAILGLEQEAVLNLYNRLRRDDAVTAAKTNG